MAEHTMSVGTEPVGNGILREKRVPVSYPSNANNRQPPPGEPPPEKEPIKPVINGRVKRKSRGASVLAETGRGVWMYVLNDVLLPSLKETLFDVVTGGTQRALWNGDMRPRGGGPTSYNRYSRPGTTTTQATTGPYAPRTISRHARSTHNFEEIILETRDEADAVMESLRELVKVYGYATVGDMLTLCDIESTFVDGQWGWTDREMVNARIVMTRGGFLLRMPGTVPIVAK
jgi:hypothetical protein